MHDFYARPENQGFVDYSFIRSKIESAGKTIMMLPSTGVWPMGYRTCLPDYNYDFSDLIEAPKANSPVLIRPTRHQLDEMAEVQEWLVGLSKYCADRQITHVARITALAMLHRPRSGKRVYSFRKLGEQFDQSHTTIQKWYGDGIRAMQGIVNAQNDWNIEQCAALTAP